MHAFPQVITVRKTATADHAVGEIVAFRDQGPSETTMPEETADEKFWLLSQGDSTSLKSDPYYSGTAVVKWECDESGDLIERPVRPKMTIEGPDENTAYSEREEHATDTLLVTFNVLDGEGDPDTSFNDADWVCPGLGTVAITNGVGTHNLSLAIADTWHIGSTREFEVAAPLTVLITESV